MTQHNFKDLKENDIHNNDTVHNSNHNINHNHHNTDEKIALIKKEVGYLAWIFLIIYFIFQIVYYKEGIITVFKTTATIYWLFIIPGYCLLFYWHENIGFLERFTVGTIAAMGLIGILSYFGGLIGIHIMYHSYIFPPLFIIVGMFFGFKDKK